MITRLRFLKIACAIIAGLCLVPACAPTQSLDDWEDFIPHSGQSFFDQISRQELVEVTLTANLDSLINFKNTNTYSRAEMTYKDETGIARTYNLKVKPRGKFRRRVCDFPPLKLKISKKELEAAGLSRHNDLKLVTHCLEDDKYSKSLVMREYLAYKLYNELTPYSFRVQLVKITYQDRHDPENRLTQFGFLIEDVDEMAERIGGKECDNCFGVEPGLVHRNQEKIASTFQFMIGNTDWNVEMSRNLKLITKPDGTYIPVPYDFDYCVLVNAPYLRPNQDLMQSPNMERIFLGYTDTVDELYSTMAYFKTKESALLNIVRNFKHLSEVERNAVEEYLNSFFFRLQSKSDAEVMIFTRTG